MTGLRRVLVSPELVEQSLREGRVQRSLRVESGLPEGARLVNIEYRPRPYAGPESCEIALIFVHEGWEPTVTGDVPDLRVLFAELEP